ncbi:DUF1152 domain-containing protein [Streptantibioticus parmotrematis]|uniref:DUF1152 domain-containing protein n=1 Tax=Streptantibioticus parmotrematis TaxID=2873249 RepID=UPI0034019E9B
MTGSARHPGKRVVIAAGGGGDPIGTAVVAHALYPDRPVVMLSYAWERLVVDPVPGPRAAADFTGLRHLTPHVPLFTPDTRPVAPAGSTLPRLSTELAPDIGLLDPYGGVPGLARQIREVVEHHGAERVDVVDVGGDVLARGDEPTLLSPLPDALVVAACATAGVATRVHVAGPGLDGEIPEEVLSPRLGDDTFTLTAEDCRAVSGVFDWHPSEASALLAAAAGGVRGGCLVRDTSRPVPLTRTSAVVFRLPLATVLSLNRLAHALYTRQCPTLRDAEHVALRVCGFDEVQRERDRAQGLKGEGDGAPGGGVRGALAALDAWAAGVTARHPTARYATFRCAAEGLGLRGRDAVEFRSRLTRARPDLHAAPLLRLPTGAAQG